MRASRKLLDQPRAKQYPWKPAAEKWSPTKLSRWRDGWNTSQSSTPERRLLSPQQWTPLPIMEKLHQHWNLWQGRWEWWHLPDLIKHCKNTILQPLHDTVCQMLEWRWCSTRYERCQDRHPELRSTRRRFNSPTLTRRRIKSSRNVGELVFNPVQLIRS